jgi:YesN/AraC family two-component response regulator
VKSRYIDAELNEIIVLLGYTNKSYFYKLFEAKHKMAPEEFRGKHLACRKGK